MQGLSRTLVLMAGCASWMLGQDPKVEYFVGYSVIETNNHAFHFSEIGSVSGLDFDEQGRGFETAVIGNVSRYFSIVGNFSAHLSYNQFPAEFCKHHPCPASETQNATVNPRLFDFLAGPEFKWRNTLGSLLLPMRFSAWATRRLDPAMFCRISRTVIVNLEYVSEVNMLLGGYGEALLKTGERLEVSRRRLRILMAKLEGVL